MRRVALGLLFLTANMACSSFGAETSPTSDGGADGGGTMDGAADAGTTTGFCASSPDAGFCEDFDEKGALAVPPWNVVSGANGKAELTSAVSAPSAPNALALQSLAGTTACDDRAGFGRTLPPAKVTKLKMESKVHLRDGAALVTTANGGPSISLVGGSGSIVSCAFYLAWQGLDPYVYVDELDSVGKNHGAVQSLKIGGAPAKSGEWETVSITIEPSTGGTSLRAAMGNAAPTTKVLAECNAAQLQYLEISTACVTPPTSPFAVDVDDVALWW